MRTWFGEPAILSAPSRYMAIQNYTWSGFWLFVLKSLLFLLSEFVFKLRRSETITYSTSCVHQQTFQSSRGSSWSMQTTSLSPVTVGTRTLITWMMRRICSHWKMPLSYWVGIKIIHPANFATFSLYCYELLRRSLGVHVCSNYVEREHPTTTSILLKSTKSRTVKQHPLCIIGWLTPWELALLGPRPRHDNLWSR